MIKKYLRFLSNLTKKKSKGNVKLSSENINYEIVYYNNYLDLTFEYLKDFVIDKNDGLQNTSVSQAQKPNPIDAVEGAYTGKDEAFNKIVDAIYDLEKEELLSLFSNIVIKVYKDENDNYQKFLSNLRTSKIVAQEDCFYISINLFDLKYLSICTIKDPGTIKLLEELFKGYTDLRYLGGYYYDTNVDEINKCEYCEFNCNIPSVKESSYNKTNYEYLSDIISIDINEDIPISVRKVYFRSQNNPPIGFKSIQCSQDDDLYSAYIGDVLFTEESSPSSNKYYLSEKIREILNIESYQMSDADEADYDSIDEYID
jgi:hypothetical protein